ncbi:MAG: hypothetical protein CBARDCOR_2422 [uncultured Caballeronia sp.]|nr:MAG: hypothetical protein CBARDCOR_2422 [uncultured Caballeronia sp.]
MLFAIFAVARRRCRQDYPHFSDTRQQLLHALTTPNGLRLAWRWTAPRGADASGPLHPDRFIWTGFQANRPVPDVRNNTIPFTSTLSPGACETTMGVARGTGGSAFQTRFPVTSAALAPGFVVKAGRSTSFSGGPVL